MAMVGIEIVVWVSIIGAEMEALALVLDQGSSAVGALSPPSPLLSSFSEDLQYICGASQLGISWQGYESNEGSCNTSLGDLFRLAVGVTRVSDMVRVRLSIKIG